MEFLWRFLIFFMVIGRKYQSQTTASTAHFDYVSTLAKYELRHIYLHTFGIYLPPTTLYLAVFDDDPPRFAINDGTISYLSTILPPITIMSESVVRSSANGDMTGTTYQFDHDPERIMENVNLSDPEELEAHLQVLDVRQRLRQRRRRMIRLFTVLFLILVVAFLVGMGLTSQEGKENAEESSLYGGKGTATTASNTVLPPPPADLSSKCSSASLGTPQGVEVCEEACEVAECCGVPEGYALSCSAANPVVCPQYQRYCQALNGPSSSGSVPSPEQGSAGGGGLSPVGSPTQLTLRENIDQKCADYVQAVNTPGQKECEELCGPSLCCFSQYCVPGPDVSCLDYAGCYVIHADPAQVEDDDAPGVDGTPTRASEIHDACFTSASIADAASDSQCKSLCAPGACCFEPNLECVNVDCSTFAECNVLYPNFLAVSKEEVDGACKNHRDVSGAEPTLCEQVCTLQVMQCCFHQNNDEGCDSVMQAPGTAYCNTYAACEVLGTSGSDLSDAHQSELEAACSSSQTRSKCISLCSAATCCYATTIAEECANVDASITCDDYSACDVLYQS